MLAEAINIGHHARVPACLIAEVTQPRALQILNHLLTLCNPQKPEVWVDQQLIGTKIGVHRDTVGRWIRYLERVGRLICQGFHHDGRRKRYLINLSTQQDLSLETANTTKSHTVTSNEIVGGPPAKQSDDLRRFCRTINREKETRIKEQTVAEISKKEFSSTESALKEKLVAIGLHTHSIEALLGCYPVDQINDQIKHLQILLEQGEDIKKPAAWLIAAIKNNYEVPVTKTEEHQQAVLSREAAVMAQTAKSLLVEGNLKEAKAFADKSIQLSPNNLAQEVQRDVQTTLEHIEKIENAQKQISAELKEELRRETEQEKAIEMRRWFKSDAEMWVSKFFKGAVDALVNQKLVEAISCQDVIVVEDLCQKGVGFK
jgi:hypothetical protein